MHKYRIKYYSETDFEEQRKVLEEALKLNKQISQLMDAEEGD